MSRARKARSARSNEFQRLVAMIQDVLAAKGARVTESAAESDSDNKDDREIDVVEERDGIPFHLKIAVEAKDHGRPMTINQFEELLGKYFTDGSIPVDHLVVVTHRGFVPKVERRSITENAYGNRNTLKQLSEIDAGEIGQWLPATREMFVAHEPPEIQIQAIEPLPPGLALPELIRNGVMSCPAGCHTADLRDYLTGYFYKSVRECNRARIKFLQERSESSRLPVVEQWVAPGNKLNWTCGQLSWQIDRIVFLIRCFSRVSFFSSRDWRLTTVLDGSNQDFRGAVVPFGNESIQMAMKRSDGFPDSIVLQCVHDPKSNGPHLMSDQGRVTFWGFDEKPLKPTKSRAKRPRTKPKG